MAHKFNLVFGSAKADYDGRGIGKRSTSPDGGYKFEDDSVFHHATNGTFLHANNGLGSSEDQALQIPHRGSPETYDPATIAPDTAPKIARQPGGRPVTYKRMGEEFDEEDSIIKQMKEAGYPDQRIVDELISQGLTAYNPKTVAARYNRILRIQRQKENERLDDELSDWHIGDDALLKKSVAHHIEKLNRDVEKANEVFYQSVADTLHGEQTRAERKVAFSKNEVRSRYEAIKNGTAWPELELDPKQEFRNSFRAQRREKIDRKIALREKERKKKEAEKRAAEEAQAAKIAADKDKRSQRAHASKLREEENMTFKAQSIAMANYFLLRNYGKKQDDDPEKDTAKVRDILDAISKGDMERRRRSEEETLIRMRNEEQKVEQMARIERKEQAAAEMAKQKQRADQSVSVIVLEDLNHMFFLEEASDIDSDEVEELEPDIERKFSAIAIREDPESDNNLRKAVDRHVNSSKIAEKAPYALTYGLNPRSKLSLMALRNLAGIRHLNTDGDKRLLVFKIAQDDEDLHITDLRKIAQDRGIAREGTRNRLLNRIALDDAGQLVGGSTYYMNYVHPKRDKLPTFESLEIDDKPMYSKGKRTKPILVDSDDESSDEDAEPDVMNTT